MATPTHRVGTGIPGLDRMLRGGLPPGRPYLLTGPNGSGRTLVGLQFLLEGLRRGEPVLLVAVDEPPHEILENVRSFGWDLSKIHTLDANPGPLAYRRLGSVQEIKSLQEVKSMQDLGDARKASSSSSSEDITLQSIFLRLRKQMEVLPARRVVIDSMTAVRHFALRITGDPQADRTEIQSLLRFLSEKEVTTVLSALPSPAEELSPEQLLCRGEIRLRREWAGPGMRRTIQITRMRGTPHDAEERPFSIAADGIHVDDQRSVSSAE